MATITLAPLQCDAITSPSRKPVKSPALVTFCGLRGGRRKQGEEEKRSRWRTSRGQWRDCKREEERKWIFSYWMVTRKSPSPNSFLSSLQALEKLYANVANLASVKILTFLCSLQASWHSLCLRHTNLHFTSYFWIFILYIRRWLIFSFYFLLTKYPPRTWVYSNFSSIPFFKLLLIIKSLIIW